MDILKIEGLYKSYKSKKEEIKVLEDINITIEDGDIYGIIGLSGEGKSTLVRCINRLETLDKGKILFFDKEINEYIDIMSLKNKELNEYRKKVAMIFQHFNLFEQKSVYDNVKFPLTLSKRKISEEDKEKIISLLEILHLKDKINRYPSELSGGEKQRVAIARALVNNPSILLCDEATSALDPETANEILEYLRKLNKELGITIVFISHQMNMVEKICNKVAILSSHKIVEEGSLAKVFMLPKSDVAKRLIYSEKLNMKLDDKRGLRLIFDGNVNEPIITMLIETCKCLVNIYFADTRVSEDKAYGQIIIQLPYYEKDIDKVKEFLRLHNIKVEEINL